MIVLLFFFFFVTHQILYVNNRFGRQLKIDFLLTKFTIKKNEIKHKK